jgi:hypothetical protein
VTEVIVQTSDESVIVQDVSSGRLHRRYRTPSGQLASLEGCNADQSGAYTVLTAEEAAHALVNAEHHQLCENDFPPVGDAA